MYVVLFLAIVLCIAITTVVILVTNKAYSKRWEDDDNEKGGQV